MPQLVIRQSERFRGLALGTAIAANINAGLLLIALSRRIGGIEFPRVLRTFIKICIASAVMGAATYYGHEWLRSALPGPSEIRRLLRVLGAIGVGMAVLAGTAHLLRLEEFGTAMSRILGKLRRTREPENPRT